MDKAQLRLSKWARFVEQRVNPERPLFLLCHEVSGEALKLSPGTALYLKELQRRGPVARKSLLREVDRSSHKILEMLERKNFLVGAQDEFSPLLEKIPVLAAGALFFKDSDGALVFLSHPDSQGGGKSELRLLGREAALVRSFDGLRTLREACEIAGIGTQEAEDAVLRLAHPNFQLLKLFSPNESNPREWLSQLHFFIQDWDHPAEVKLAKRRARLGETVDLREFHQHGIKDAFHEFDEVETTVSHAFRRPNPVLGGKSYGEAFCRALVQQHLLKPGMKVVEVGGGTGIFSRELLRHAPKDTDYTIVDIAPELQASQQKIHTAQGLRTKFLLMNAETMRLKEKVDLILSNEVIADFRTVELNRKKKKATGAAAECWKRIKEYKLDIDAAPPKFFFNLGAIRFLERIHACLADGGAALITEFGSLTRFPSATHHLNHDEYSIHWGHLLKAAEKIGFRSVELIDLATLIPFNQQEEMYDGDVTALNHILSRFGKTALEPAAYSRREIEATLARWPELVIHGLTFSPFHEETYWGPSVSEFKALVIRK